MKHLNKLIKPWVFFSTVVSCCCAFLVCFILFVYPNLNYDTAPQSKSTSSKATGIVLENSAKEASAPVSIDTNNNSSEIVVPDISSLTEGQAEITDNSIPAEYRAALNKANSYSDIMHMSKASIYDQLVSEYGENFPADAAQYAVDNMIADWNSNALQKAKDYCDTMYMSKASIYDQLISGYGEKFSPSEAQYAIDNLVADYNFNALQKAKDYQTTMNMSLSAIHDQLTSEYGEKFTQEEADYAVKALEGTSLAAQSIINAPQFEDTITYDSYGNGNNINSFATPAQPQTTTFYVLNTNPSRMRIHLSTCRDVPNIATENYSTSDLSIIELEAQGYTRCGHCLK